MRGRRRLPVVACGGVSTLDDLRALAALEPIGVEGVIVGKALYAGRVHGAAGTGGCRLTVNHESDAPKLVWSGCPPQT